MMDQISNIGPYFKTNFLLSLKLEADGKEAELPTVNIEKMRFKLHSYGFSCYLQMATFDNDDVHEIMTGPKAIKATLAFKPVDPKDGTEPIVELKGIIKNKTFTRLPANFGKYKQAHRVYEIDFCDNARATFQEHSPIDIFADASMKDVIEKHGNPEVTLNYKWDHLEIKHPVIAFNLERKNGNPTAEQTNFYSFLIWYLHQENGILEYDYKEHDYTITGKKKEASGEPLKLRERFITSPRCFLAQNARYNERTHKHTTHNLEHEDKENEHSFQSVRQEISDPNNYRISPEQTQEKVQSAFFSDKNEVEFNLKEFTKEIQLDKLMPGSFVTFKGAEEGNWTSDDCYNDKNFRIRLFEFDAEKIGETEDVTKHIQGFNFALRIRLEEEDADFVEWPRFVPPIFPFNREGHVFSDIGEEDQSTYKILESEKAPQGQYVVHVPIDKEIKKVVAPFVPYFSGQYFFPFIKGAKVRVSLYFHTAKIIGPTDWDALARLPPGVQGNQIVLASNTKDKYTIMGHEYVDGKESVYSLRQSSSEVQAQTFAMKEKDILFLVAEKDKISLSIQVKNDLGVVLSYENKDTGNQHQIIVGDEKGDSITLTSKGNDGTSKVAVAPASIAMDAEKEIIINSRGTILLKAADSIEQDAPNKCAFKSNIFDAPCATVNLGPS